MDYDLRLWTFVWDMNVDGAITISDVWLWFKWLFYYPGDGMFYVMMRGAPKAAKFFEVSAASFGGGVSGGISFITWLIAFGLLNGTGSDTQHKSST